MGGHTEFTVRQAAERLGIAAERVYEMIHQGRLEARKDEHDRWRVTTRSVNYRKRLMLMEAEVSLANQKAYGEEGGGA